MSNTFKLFCPGAGTLNSEDAYPIKTDNMLLVADGLGGTGGFAHSCIDERALNPECFFDVFFDGMFAELSCDDKEVIKEYVNMSFGKYFEIPREEKQNRRCIFKSGYFASRIVAALVYGHILALGKDKVKDLVCGFSDTGNDKESLAKKEQQFGQEMAEFIFSKLEKVAKNANLIYEPKFKGMMLLPTTLVTVLYEEYDDYVDAVYLWAGDSRGYAWDKNGLIQVSEDHESDGIMTNLVTLNAKFKISCKYVRINKPCALFCTSDGCYTCLQAPLDFEYHFFDKIANALSYEEASEKLRDFYMQYSQDDTNTVSFQAFGYDNYDAFCEDVKARMAELEEKYASRLPDLFSSNYRRERDSAKREIKTIASKLQILEHPRLKAHVFAEMGLTEGVENNIKRNDQLLVDALKRLKIIVQDNYIEIGRILYKTNSRDKYCDAELMDIVEEIENARTQFVNSLSDIENRIDGNASVIKAFLKSQSEVGPYVCNDNVVNVSCEFFGNLRDAVRSIMQGKNRYMEDIEDLNKKLQKKTYKNIENTKVFVDRIVADLVNETLSVDVLVGFGRLNELRESVEQAVLCSDTAKKGGIDGDIKMTVEKFWNKNCSLIICDFYHKYPDDEVWKVCGEQLIPLVKQYDRYNELQNKRDALNTEYEKYYYQQGENE